MVVLIERYKYRGGVAASAKMAEYYTKKELVKESRKNLALLDNVSQKKREEYRTLYALTVLRAEGVLESPFDDSVLEKKVKNLVDEGLVKETVHTEKSGGEPIYASQRMGLFDKIIAYLKGDVKELQKVVGHEPIVAITRSEYYRISNDGKELLQTEKANLRKASKALRSIKIRQRSQKGRIISALKRFGYSMPEYVMKRAILLGMVDDDEHMLLRTKKIGSYLKRGIREETISSSAWGFSQRSSDDESGCDFMLAALVGYATNNTLLGYLIGGNITGAIVGDLLNDVIGDSDDSESSDSDSSDSDSSDSGDSGDSDSD